MSKDLALEVLAKFGVPAVISLFLVWFVTSSLTAKVDQHVVDSREEHHQTIELLRAICYNTAEDGVEVARCGDGRSR